MAEEYLVNAINTNPEHPEALYNLGIFKRLQGKGEESFQYLKRAYEASSTNATFALAYLETFLFSIDRLSDTQSIEAIIRGLPTPSNVTSQEAIRIAKKMGAHRLRPPDQYWGYLERYVTNTVHPKAQDFWEAIAGDWSMSNLTGAQRAQITNWVDTYFSDDQKHHFYLFPLFLGKR
ncbi:MAG: hypothetical protein DME24_24395 [Verrucomicrobia bacterium]|nr:MAG: hypothetical protein DME24_24395 [Verrucomicrobiota bacterium]